MAKVAFWTGIAALVLAGGLIGCRQRDTPEECAEMASTFLDPAWAPRTVIATPEPVGGMNLQLTITAQGRSVAVGCPEGMTTGGRTFKGEVTLQGRTADPGQLYLVDQNRWLTEDERLARVQVLLTPRGGEFSGRAWRSGSAVAAPGAIDGCFQIDSNLDPEQRILSTCRTAQGRRYWMSEHRMEAEIVGPPADTPPIPKVAS